jgi:hypothetical protein
MVLTFFGKRGDNMPFFDRIPPKATKARLIEMLNQEQRYSNVVEITAKQRVGDLLEANNRYLERARASEQSLRECEAAIDKLKDELAELRGEKDALVIQNLEETTWLRMSKAQVEKQRDGYIDDAKGWARVYADYRQKTEIKLFTINERIKNLRAYAITGLALDAVLWFGAFLVLMGALPPMFPELPWWWK